MIVRWRPILPRPPTAFPSSKNREAAQLRCTVILKPIATARHLSDPISLFLYAILRKERYQAESQDGLIRALGEVELFKRRWPFPLGLR